MKRVTKQLLVSFMTGGMGNNFKMLNYLMQASQTTEMYCKQCHGGWTNETAECGHAKSEQDAYKYLKLDEIKN